MRRMLVLMMAMGIAASIAQADLGKALKLEVLEAAPPQPGVKMPEDARVIADVKVRLVNVGSEAVTVNRWGCSSWENWKTDSDEVRVSSLGKTAEGYTIYSCLSNAPEPETILPGNYLEDTFVLVAGTKTASKKIKLRIGFDNITENVWKHIKESPIPDVWSEPITLQI